jgi:pyruvate dehydrogenase E2 component (dihydrolipoamide acetyltransferase)
MAVQVILPVLGETMDEGTIVRWLVEVGQFVEKGDPLYEVETDKAVLEVEAPAAGVLRKIFHPAGSKVAVLSAVGLIADAKEEVSASELLEQQDEVSAGSELAVMPSASSPPSNNRILASPRARRRAADRGVKLSEVRGSGPAGRIVERDVQKHLAAQRIATPTARKVADDHGVDLVALRAGGESGRRVTKADVEALLSGAAKGAPLGAEPTAAERMPLQGIRAVIAERMSTSAHTTARVTLTTEVDGAQLVQLRKVLNEHLEAAEEFKVAYTDILVAVVARALGDLRYMNVRLRGEEIECLASINVGVAVDTERGLLVPVVRDADTKTIVEIASTLHELTARARSGKSMPDDLTGGTFTITNLGMYGIDAFTPIINPPECAILGVGRLREVPVVHDGGVRARPMMVLSMTFDHRLVDGAPAARFLQRISELVEEPYLLLA